MRDDTEKTRCARRKHDEQIDARQPPILPEFRGVSSRHGIGACFGRCDVLGRSSKNRKLAGAFLGDWRYMDWSMQLLDDKIQNQDHEINAAIGAFMGRHERTLEWFHASDEDHLGHLEQELRVDVQEFLRFRLEGAAQKKADDTPPICPECGRKLSKCEKHERSFQTGAGTIRIIRVRGWCARCKKWRIPADHALGLEEGNSPYVQELAATFASKMPFAEAAQVMKKTTGVEMSESALKRTVKKAGQKAKETRRKGDAQASRGEIQPGVTPGPKQPVTMIIEIDAWNLRERDHWGDSAKMRKKGLEPSRWHWVWTATVFTLDQRAKKGARHVIVQRGYVATRAGMDALREQLHAEAMRRGLGQVDRVLVLGDGAAWIWNLTQDRFPEAEQRVDLYHVHQHLWAASQQLHEDPAEALKWHKRMKKILARSQAIKVIQSMEESLDELEAKAREALSKEIHYFSEHQRRMDYKEARRRNEPQGSGAIESTCRQYQCRFKRPGQFWNTEGAEGLLCVDTFWRNDRWSQLFPPSSRSLLSRN